MAAGRSTEPLPWTVDRYDLSCWCPAPCPPAARSCATARWAARRRPAPPTASSCRTPPSSCSSAASCPSCRPRPSCWCPSSVLGALGLDGIERRRCDQAGRNGRRHSKRLGPVTQRKGYFPWQNGRAEGREREGQQGG